jgi:multidrug efflux pump subunit AcrB
MNLAAWAMRYKPIVLTAVVLLMGWGTVSYFTMPRREDPEYTVRTCVITTYWPGAPAEKVEELITDPLEKAVNSINGVDKIRSTTRVGVSTIYVDVEDRIGAKEIDNLWDKVRARVARVKMPEAGIKPDVNDEYGDTYVILLAVYQKPPTDGVKVPAKDRYSLRQLDVISEFIADQLKLLPGVAKSEQYGVREEAIYIETGVANWAQLGLTVTELQKLLEARNIVAPGGDIDLKAGRFAVKPGGEFNAVEEINSIVVGATERGTERRPVTLKDAGLKVVRDYQDPPRVICRFGNAKLRADSVIVAVTMKKGANIVKVCDAVKARVAQMQNIEKTVPPDIGVTPVSDQSTNVTKKINDVVVNVVEAILIVVVVVFLIVGFRSAAVMAANIPVVVLSSIAIMTLFGVDLEQISLASIIIALGLLVDNAVQVSDQCRTNQINGLPPDEAAVTGTTQVATPMLMGTATTVAAFIPMLFALEGSKREYVYSLPVTLSVTLAVSWIMALTFCTILAARFIRAPKDPNKPSAPIPWLMATVGALFRRAKPEAETAPGEKREGTILRALGVATHAAIKMKFITIGVSLALFVAAIMLPVGSEFFPKDLRDQMAVEVWLPENVGIEQTNEAAKQVEAALQKLSPTTDAEGNKVEQIRAMRTAVGYGGARWYLGRNPEPVQPNYAEILVRTTDPRFTPNLARRLREVVRDGDAELGIKPIAGVRVIPRELFLGPPAEPVEIRLIGSGFADMKTLRTFADRLKDIVRKRPGTWDVYDTWGAQAFQLRVDVNDELANLAGVTNARVAQTMNAYFTGQELTTFREGDHLVPVKLRLRQTDRPTNGAAPLTSEESRTALEGLRGLRVEGARGKVPLDSIATITPRWDPGKIERRYLNRLIEIRAKTEDGYRGNDIVNDIMASDEMKQLKADLPSGYRIEIGGMMEESAKSQKMMQVSLVASIVLIVMLLVIQYNGFSKPIIICITLPLALIGALAGLWITGNPLGFMPQLGILSLFGIVLNTAIIFMEFADVLILEAARNSDGSGPICGLTKAEFRACLVQACKQRLLPIFLTTATTIGGLLPLALAGGPLWAAMAWCMIFGLAFATVLTLLVVPALYAVFVETFGVKPVRLE